MKSINKQELHNIFKGIAEKEESNFNKLYERYNKLVYAISFSILKNKENSEDITQIVFTKIWNMNTNNLPTSNEASWLYSITKNEVYYINNDDKEINEIIEKDTYNRMIAKLDEKEQEIVSLKILSGLSFKEISQILNMPMGTVQWRYYKSLHTLETLISSISLYIVTIIIFIAQKGININKRKSNIPENTETENVIIKEKEENSEIQEDKSETQKVELPNYRVNNIEGEKILESEETNNKDKETIIEMQKENNNINMYDIGILSFLGILLIITIIFTHIFRKHQQNLRKKVSK